MTCIRFGVPQEDKLRSCEDWKSKNQTELLVWEKLSPQSCLKSQPSLQNTSSFTLDPSMSTLRNYMTLCTGISVNHFCRLPGLLERIGTRLAATIARAYVDDWITTDFPHAGDSAQQCISAIHKHKAIRIPLHACNHPSCPNCTSNPRGPVPTLNQSAKDVAQPPSKSLSAQFVTSLTLTWVGSHTGLSH